MVDGGDQVRDWVGFTARCLKRHRWLALLMAVAFAGATVAAFALLPKRWKVISRIHAAPLEGSPGAARPPGGGPLALTLPAVEAALSQAWLEQTSRELQLLARRDRHRAWISRFKQRLTGSLLGSLFPRVELSEAQRERLLAEDLRGRLRISLDADSVILELSWPDRDGAVELLRRAEERLLSFRRDVELAPLEARERSVELAVNASRAELARMQRSSGQLSRRLALARDDEERSWHRARLSREMDRMAQLQSDFTNARAQLDAERAAFGQRYVVIAPVQQPRSPAFPQLLPFLLAAVVGSASLAIFSAVGRDLWGARVVEAWQVSRVTGLQLMGEVEG